MDETTRRFCIGINLNMKEYKQMKCPNHITHFALHNLIDSQTEINGIRQPSRPFGYGPWYQRFILAWWVLIGKADALTWPGQ